MVNVIGLGYIGLPTALMLAAHGIDVIGTDYNEQLICTLNSGHVTFKEEGLESLFKKAIDKGIVFQSEYAVADIYIVSVPTPFMEDTKKVDSTYVVRGVLEILKVCPTDATIVIESTVSPGTIDKYIRPLLVDKNRTDINLVHAPERIIPGNMIAELQNNNRTIGADSHSIGNKIKQIYSTFCKGNIRITSIKVAEMTKVVENTYRAVNIALANELVQLCKVAELDVYEVIDICNLHPRVNILSPGPGVGGHCIPIDPWFLVGDYPQNTTLIRTALQINRDMPKYVLARIQEIMALEGITELSKVGLYGLSYKENVDDYRESPTLQLIKASNDAFKIYDPLISNSIVETQYQSIAEFSNSVEMVVIMVGHSNLKDDVKWFDKKIILDTRNVISNSNIYRL